MAIQIADNFSYQGKKPLDGRITFSTVSAMVSTSDAILYNGCLGYVEENKTYYTYDSTNETDPTLGKWRVKDDQPLTTEQINTLIALL